MSEYILRLTPQGEGLGDLELELFPEPPETDSREEEGRVFSDFAYSGSWRGPEADGEMDAFYINGVKIPLGRSGTAGDIPFSGDRRIFNDYFGFVYFTLKLQQAGGERTLYSRLVPVYVNDSPASEDIGRSLSRMADYVYQNCEPFWQEDQLFASGEDKMVSLTPSGLKQTEHQSLASQLELLHAIIRTYEKSLPFFRTGSRYRVRPEKQWVDFERAAYLSGDTVHSILQRPDYLIPAARGGMRIPGREGAWLPTKVIAGAGQVDYNLYENRYVLGFLRYLVDKTAAISASLKKRLREAGGEKNEGNPLNGFIDSTYFIHGSMPQRLREELAKLETARVRLSELYAAYCKILPASPDHVRDAPKGTAIFRAVHHYRSIYGLACQWFRFGVYDFWREDFLLPFVEGHRLYEFYALLRLLHHLKDGWGLPERFAVPWRKAEYGDAQASPQSWGRPNLFSFRRGDETLTVFYEPRIFCREYPWRLADPPLELFRSNLPSYDKKSGWPEGLHHYKPDYVVRFCRGSGPAYYVLLDAKFSSRATTEAHHMPELILKYLTALSPYHLEDRILGLCLLYGKLGSEEAGDLFLNRRPIPADFRPFIRLVPLWPENEKALALEEWVTE